MVLLFLRIASCILISFNHRVIIPISYYDSMLISKQALKREVFTTKDSVVYSDIELVDRENGGT